MNVKELIAKLEAVKDKNLVIETEGCDCDGDNCGVEVENNRVYITRDEEVGGSDE